MLSIYQNVRMQLSLLSFEYRVTDFPIFSNKNVSVYWDYESSDFRRVAETKRRYVEVIVLLSTIKKVVSATFLLVCFVSIKNSICETRKDVFYFTSKAIFVLEIIKF